MRCASEEVQEAASALKRGEPAVFPTDTVYGLGVSVEHAESPEALYLIKRRDAEKPIAWLVGGVGALSVYGDAVPEEAYALARAFWPGALTIVVRAASCVPKAFASAAGTIGLRCPAHRDALALIDTLGCPIATTSANLSGCADASALSAVPDEVARRAGALVGGAPGGGVASTIVECTEGSEPRILREGPVSASQIARALEAVRHE